MLSLQNCRSAHTTELYPVVRWPPEPFHSIGFATAEELNSNGRIRGVPRTDSVIDTYGRVSAYRKSFNVGGLAKGKKKTLYKT